MKIITRPSPHEHLLGCLNSSRLGTWDPTLRLNGRSRTTNVLETLTRSWLPGAFGSNARRVSLFVPLAWRAWTAAVRFLPLVPLPYGHGDSALYGLGPACPPLQNRLEFKSRKSWSARGAIVPRFGELILLGLWRGSSTPPLHPTLAFTQCNDLLFVLTLNPNKNLFVIVLHRELEIILDVKHPDQPRNNKLPSFKNGQAIGVGWCEAFEITSMDALAPTKERPGRETCLAGVSEFDDVPSEWDPPTHNDGLWYFLIRTRKRTSHMADKNVLIELRTPRNSMRKQNTEVTTYQYRFSKNQQAPSLLAPATTSVHRVSSHTLPPRA